VPIRCASPGEDPLSAQQPLNTYTAEASAVSEGRPQRFRVGFGQLVEGLAYRADATSRQRFVIAEGFG
jgi:hypothetical protein